MLSYLFIQIEYKKIHKERYLYQFIIYKQFKFQFKIQYKILVSK